MNTSPISIRRLCLILCSTAVFLSFAACSIPTSGPVSPIEPARIPFDLNAVTTTGPSTTLAKPTTTPAPTQSSTTSSTSIPLTLETVHLFYIAGDQLVPIDRLLLSPATEPQVLAALAEGIPEGDTAVGLRSSLPTNFSPMVSVLRGIATVILDATFINDVLGLEQRFAIAQIVLTLTSRAGIGQVIFVSQDKPQSVPRGRGDLTEPGDVVTCDDYANLLPTGYAC